MSDKQSPQRVFVLAGNNRQFLEFCHYAKLVPGHQAVYISGVEVLQGRREYINLVKFGTFYERNDASQIETLIGQMNTLIEGHDVKILGEIEEGQRVRANGREFVVDSVMQDQEGNLQITLVIPTSRYVTERAVANARRIPVKRDGDEQTTLGGGLPPHVHEHGRPKYAGGGVVQAPRGDCQPGT